MPLERLELIDRQIPLEKPVQALVVVRTFEKAKVEAGRRVVVSRRIYVFVLKESIVALPAATRPRGRHCYRLEPVSRPTLRLSRSGCSCCFPRGREPPRALRERCKPPLLRPAPAPTPLRLPYDLDGMPPRDGLSTVSFACACFVSLLLSYW